MKAISLHQPWATLMAIGAKRIETRSWPTRYRGPLAIHATQCRDYLDLCAEEPFRSALLSAHYRGPADLPFGCVVAIAHLAQCLETDLVERFIQPFTEQERAFGDYEPGRFAWIMSAVADIDPPVPARGRQRLWDWEGAR